MEYTENAWTFAGENTTGFDSHVRQSVPLYDKFQEEITKMSCYFIQDYTNVIDVGTSTGNMIHSIKESNKRNADFIGIDIEYDMISECKKRYKDIEFHCMNAINFDFTNTSVITSMLALQFMSIEERKILLKKINNQLNEGGALFVVEKVRTPVPFIHDMYNDLYYDFKLQSFTPEEVLLKNQSLRGVMNPLTVQEDIELFKEAGFTKIDIFLKIENFVGFVIIK